MLKMSLCPQKKKIQDTKIASQKWLSYSTVKDQVTHLCHLLAADSVILYSAV